MDANLLNQTLTWRDQTYNLLTSMKNYGFFSNDSYPGPRTDPVNYASLETIHNGIHGNVGNGGHMGIPDFAAFDPIFMMHHANVDRLFAMWQGTLVSCSPRTFGLTPFFVHSSQPELLC